MIVTALSQRFCMCLAAFVTFAIIAQPYAARADAPATLTAIADTADRICGIVSTEGDTKSHEVQGQINAELNGLAKRLANIGGAGSADFSASRYQGLLQKDLPTTLDGVRACKLHVFDLLRTTILPGSPSTPAPAPGAPSADLLQAPANAPVSDSVTGPGKNIELGLYSCSNDPNKITCYIIVSKITPGPADINIPAWHTNLIELVDNFHIKHALRSAYFIDGLGSHQQEMNFASGEGVWLTLEFPTVAKPISSDRIIFGNIPVAPQLRATVN